MKAKFLRNDTCELCGEGDVDLYIWDALPEHLEDLDGICCEHCGVQHEEEFARQQEIDKDSELYKMFDEWAEYSDMSDAW